MGIREAIDKKAVPASADLPALIVIGNGPVGVHFVNQLVSRHWYGSIHLFGEEPYQPYNRVQLSAFLNHEIHLGQLDNQPTANSRLFQHVGCRIVKIDRDNHRVLDQFGSWHHYDYLVLATGSVPHIPSIQGLKRNGVFRFRVMRDAESLCARLTRSRHTVIIGGGLLGLETARAMTRYATKVTIVQHSTKLMNRQLDDIASARIKQFAEQAGIEVRLGQSVREVQGENQVETLLLSTGEVIQCDTLVLATGIVPNTELALDAGIRIRGGVQIDNALRTSDESIFAIGECADFESQVYGLVAPGLEQAGILAGNLTGACSSYHGSTLIAELKVLGLPVFSMGMVSDEFDNLISREVNFQSRDIYRRLYLRNNHLVGVVAVGNWQEIKPIQATVLGKKRLSMWQLLRFRRTGFVFGEAASDFSNMPAATQICNCQQVSLGTIREHIHTRQATLADLVTELKVASVCGSCKPLLQQILQQPVEQMPVKRPLLVTAVLASLFAGTLALTPALPVTQSVLDPGMDWLWSETLARQISGFSILTLTLLSLVVSLRKRIHWFRRLNFERWRIVHGLLVSMALLVLFVHTGSSMGEGINRWLLIDFLLITLVGIGSALAAAVEGYWIGPGIKRLKRTFVLGHIIACWPIPVLLGFHIASVYYF